MTQDSIINEYFDWLICFVHEQPRPTQISYIKVLTRLHNIEFVYSIANDHNRAEDGENLRYRFAITSGYEEDTMLILDYLRGPCTVLEMMIALVLRCEETIMDDPSLGDRTGQWFWGMIVNLGLGAMTDDKFDKQTVDYVIDKFLNRDYEPDGKGGLFTVKHCEYDLRTLGIWSQLCRYLNNVTFMKGE